MHIHRFAFLLCRKVPSASQHPFRLGHQSLSCPLLACIRFLLHPLPSIPSVLLAESLPHSVREHIRVTKFRWVDTSDATGVLCRPGAASSVRSIVCQANRAGLLTFWCKRLNLFRLSAVTTLVRIQHMFLRSAISLADWRDQVSSRLHVVPQASHRSVTGSACCGRDVLNG